MPLELRNGFTACVEDLDGYIWFGCHGGLFRYDGVDCKSYPSNETGSALPGNKWVQALRLDLNGNLWIGGDGWISRLNPRTGRIKTWKPQWNEPNGTGNDWNAEFVCDRFNPNILWFPINSSEALFGRFDVKANKFELIPLPDSEKGLRGYGVRHCDLVQDSSGVLIQGRIGTVAVYNPESGRQWVYYASDPGKHFDLLLAQNKGAVCLDFDSIYKILPESISALPNTKNAMGKMFGTMAPLTDEQYLVLENTFGLIRYDNVTHSYAVVASNNSLISQNLRSGIGVLYKDRNERFWISSSGIMLLDMNRNHIRSLDKVNASISKFNFAEQQVKAMYWHVKEKRMYLFFTQASDLYQVDIESGEIEQIPIPFRRLNASVSTITQNPQTGNLIFIYDTRLCEWNSTTKTLTSKALKIDPEIIKRGYLSSTSILVDTLRHCYWVCDFWNGAIRYDYATHTTYCYSTKEGFPISNNIRAKAVVDEDVYFISHTGLCKFNYRKNTFFKVQPPFSSADDPGSFRFNDLVIGHNNTLWLSSPRGLFQYNIDSAGWKQFTTKQGLVVNDITEISFIDDEKLILSGEESQLYIFNTVKQSSLICTHDQFPPNVSSYLAEDGTVIFEDHNRFWGGQRGDFLKPLTAFPPIIVSIQEHNKELALPEIPERIKEIALEHDQNFITIGFACLNYSFSDHLNYEYQLEGLNQSWIPADKSQLASFSFLPPGKYLFRLRVKDINSIWQERQFPLRIIIHPAWWQTWWFRIFLAMAIGAIVFVLAKENTKRKLRMQRIEFEKQQRVLKERNRIASELHDDLGSGLTKISLMSQIAEKISGDKQRQTLNKISVESGEMVDKMNGIIWALNIQNDTLSNLIAFIREQTQKMFEDTTVRFVCNMPELVPDMPVSGEFRRNLYLIVKEAFHNALKYAEASVIELSISLEKNTLEIQVGDNEKGFAATSGNHKGNGMLNMRKRATAIQGTLTISSEPGKGTNLSLRCELPGYTKV